MVAGIYTKDLDYGYKVRGVFHKFGYDLQYINSEQELMTFMLTNQSIRLLIDVKYSNCYSQIYDYVKEQLDAKMIILTDNQDVDFVGNSENCYIANLETLANIIPSVMRRKEISGCCKYDMSSLTIKIMDNLQYFGISPNHAGYDYLQEGITIAVTTNSKLVCKKVYQMIGESQHTRASNVEKCIRDSIQKAVVCIPEAYVGMVFHKDRVTNATFISHVAKRIQLSYLKDK